MTWKDDDDTGADSLDLGFNAEDAEPMSFDMLPVGEYGFLIKEVAIKESKKSTVDEPNKYLKLTLVVTDEGPFKGRYVWDQMTTHNPNPEAVKIGRAKIAAVFKAAGVGGSDAGQLVQRDVRASVGVKPASGGYEASNVIKSYKFAASTAPAAASKEVSTAAAPSGEPAKRKPPPFVKG